MLKLCFKICMHYVDVRKYQKLHYLPQGVVSNDDPICEFTTGFVWTLTRMICVSANAALAFILLPMYWWTIAIVNISFNAEHPRWLQRINRNLNARTNLHIHRKKAHYHCNWLDSDSRTATLHFLKADPLIFHGRGRRVSFQRFVTKGRFESKK